MKFRGEQFRDAFGVCWVVATVEPCPSGSSRFLVTVTSDASTRTAVVPGTLAALTLQSIGEALSAQSGVEFRQVESAADQPDLFREQHGVPRSPRGL